MREETIERSIPNQVTTVPPRPGPISIKLSAARMICSSCSTTSDVFPLSRRLCITRTNRPTSRGCLQTDAWLVHDKQRVRQRGTETSCEVHPLHSAAAQSAHEGPIQREIADADFAEIIEARADFRRATFARSNRSDEISDRASR